MWCGTRYESFDHERARISLAIWIREYKVAVYRRDQA